MGKNYYFQTKPDKRDDEEGRHSLIQAHEAFMIAELDNGAADKAPSEETGVKLTPLRNEMYVKPFVPKKTTSSGIFIPKTAQNRPSKALVLAVGRGTELHPMTLQKGDIVFHVQGAGTLFNNEQGEDIWLIKSTDCLAVIPKQD
jgi:chaperonin GroES